MKISNTIKIVLAAFLILSCSHDPKNASEEQEVKSDSIIVNDENGPGNDGTKDVMSAIDISILDHLSPMVIIHAESKNVYNKYGIDLNGNCYECDLANLEVNEKSVKLVNVCDENNYKIRDITGLTNAGNALTIKTKENEFVFTKIDDAPVYELKITGKNPEIKGLRISRFYTPKKILNNFEQHDCGDFQG